LADAVRKGRRKEFAGAYAKYGDQVPDPLDEATFQSAILDWQAPNTGRQRLTLVQELLSIRHREIVPRLAGARFGDATAQGNGLLSAHWRLGDGSTLCLLANLSGRDIPGTRSQAAGTKIWGSDLYDVIPPWSVYWHIGHR
jgi:maltooligosyltrehalose trehalohydrolase